MNVTSVELHPANSLDSLELSYRDPGRTKPFNVKAIVGLDVEDIIPRHHGLSIQKRVVTMRLELNPNFSGNQTYSNLRDEVYRLISSSRSSNIEIRFKNGETVVAVLNGVMTKVEAPQFTKTPEVQLTFNCSDPFLVSPESIEVALTGLNPASTVINDDISTAPHGFVFAVEFTDTIFWFSIKGSDWEFKVQPSYTGFNSFLAGDILYVSSERNNRYIYAVRGSTTYQLASDILIGSLWPIIYPGPNLIECLTSPASALNWNSIAYRHVYWGV